ncbi:MAG: PLDc N-terminal domain-containing protein [Propionibacteriales bacterium]|nr:PLDc N-terminal domain-containing protein [Propionibacteriales bacterium]
MRFLLPIIVIVLYIYAWLEIAQSDPRQVRQLPRWAWSLVVLAPLAGAACWLIFGRPNGTEVAPIAPKPRPRVIAPDDDPDFLRSLRKPKPPPDDDKPSSS